MKLPTRTPAPAAVTGPSCYRCGRVLSPAERVFCGGCASPIPVLLPAHHGAGVSTLAMVTGFRDAEESENTIGHPRMLRLLVARTHRAGLEAARQAIAGFRDNGTDVRLLLVPDAPGKLPKPLADLVTILAGPTPVSRIPWVEAWRWAPGTPSETFTRFYPTLTAQLIADAP